MTEPNTIPSSSRKHNNGRLYIYVLLAIVAAAAILIAILTLAKGTGRDQYDTDDTEQEEELVQRKLKLRGTVDAYPVVMQLTIEGNVATGTYYYESQGPEKVLYLKGVCEGSKLELYESDSNGQQTGRFKGMLKRGLFVGDFFNMRGNKMHFRLER